MAACYHQHRNLDTFWLDVFLTCINNLRSFARALRLVWESRLFHQSARLLSVGAQYVWEKTVVLDWPSAVVRRAVRVHSHVSIRAYT